MDAIDRLNASGQPCLMLISDAGGGEGPKSLYIFERWCPLILTTQSEHIVYTQFQCVAFAAKHSIRVPNMITLLSSQSLCLSDHAISLVKV